MVSFLTSYSIHFHPLSSTFLPSTDSLSISNSTPPVLFSSHLLFYFLFFFIFVPLSIFFIFSFIYLSSLSSFSSTFYFSLSSLFTFFLLFFSLSLSLSLSYLVLFLSVIFLFIISFSLFYNPSSPSILLMFPIITYPLSSLPSLPFSFIPIAPSSLPFFQHSSHLQPILSHHPNTLLFFLTPLPSEALGPFITPSLHSLPLPHNPFHPFPIPPLPPPLLLRPQCVPRLCKVMSAVDNFSKQSTVF